MKRIGLAFGIVLVMGAYAWALTPNVIEQNINASSGADVTVQLPESGYNYVRSFEIQSVGGLAFRLAFASGEIAADDFVLVEGGEWYYRENLDENNLTLYIRGNTGASDTVKVLVWQY